MSHSTPVTPSPHSLNVLIVDDSATMRAILHRVIGFTELPIAEIYQAAHGGEALEVLRTHRVQAVFTDVNMPVMNGIELLREMATHPEWAEILRIVVSTDGSRLRRDEARDLNVNLYIEKPFRPEVVRDVLCSIVAVEA